MSALNHVLALPGHVVAQVIKTEFVVRAVCDVGVVLLASHLGRLIGENTTDRHSQHAENSTHQLRLVGRQVIVRSDDVNPSRRDCIEEGGQGGHERFPFTRLHFRNIAKVKGGSTHYLNVVVAEAKGTFRCLAHGGKRLWE